MNVTSTVAKAVAIPAVAILLGLGAGWLDNWAHGGIYQFKGEPYVWPAGCEARQYGEYYDFSKINHIRPEGVISCTCASASYYLGSSGGRSAQRFYRVGDDAIAIHHDADQCEVFGIKRGVFDSAEAQEGRLRI